MPRLTPPGSGTMAGPLQPLWASSVQTRLSSNVAPAGGAGTLDGLALFSDSRVMAEKPASGGTLTVTSPSPKLRWIRPTSWTSKHLFVPVTDPPPRPPRAAPPWKPIPLSLPLPFPLPLPLLSLPFPLPLPLLSLPFPLLLLSLPLLLLSLSLLFLSLPLLLLSFPLLLLSLPLLLLSLLSLAFLLARAIEPASRPVGRAAYAVI